MTSRCHDAEIFCSKQTPETRSRWSRNLLSKSQDPVIIPQKTKKRETMHERTSYCFKKRFVSIKRDSNGRNGVLLRSNLQPLVGRPDMQVLCISKRRKTKRQVQAMDPAIKIRNYVANAFNISKGQMQNATTQTQTTT